MAPSRLSTALVALLGVAALGALVVSRDGPASAAESLRAAPDARPPQARGAPAPVDAFHPDARPDAQGRRPAPPRPALGGSVSVHINARPARLCTALDGSAVVRRIGLELHDSLLRQDWESWAMEPAVARAWTVEDQLVLSADAPEELLARARTLQRRAPDGGGASETVRVLFGALEAPLDADGPWRVLPRSPGHPLDRPLEVPAAAVREVVRGSVVTFELRDDVLWHPSPGFPAHRLDARDVLFSWSLYANPEVDCGERRYQYLKVAAAEQVGPAAVRFLVGQQDAWIVDDLGELCLFPSHHYDLSDPDNPDHDPDASAAEQARHVNENPHNRAWIGLGPYRLVEIGEQAVEAERFDGYYDRARMGYLDRIRWRYVRSDTAALQALLSGELDFTDRVGAEDYFGQATAGEAFTARLYKGWYSTGSYAYVCWNTQHPFLADARVRRALGHCLDVEDLLQTWYKGLGNVVTGPAPFHSPGYDHGVAPLGFDLGRAERLLAEAGWYDRDGDGWVDRDGERLRLEYAAIAGSEFTRHVGLLLQANLERVGVELSVREYEWGTFTERAAERSLDAFCQAWLPPLEQDPEQMWHSRWARPGVASANYAGLRDEVVDALIERGQRELDDEARSAIWRRLHARIAELQPFLFLINPATKFALDRRLRGFQSFAIDPGYSIRRWYLPEGTPGTRPADGIGHWAGR